DPDAVPRHERRPRGPRERLVGQLPQRLELRGGFAASRAAEIERIHRRGNGSTRRRSEALCSICAALGEMPEWPKGAPCLGVIRAKPVSWVRIPLSPPVPFPPKCTTAPPRCCKHLIPTPKYDSSRVGSCKRVATRCAARHAQAPMLVARASARPKAFPSGVRGPVTPTAVPATKKATVLAAANIH